MPDDPSKPYTPYVIPAPAGTDQFPNRRCTPRYPFIAQAEVVDLGSGARLSTRTSEVGMRGCYLDMINPIPEGTSVKVCLRCDKGTFEAPGKVVYCQPGFGMGIAFGEVAPAQQKILESWLAEFAGNI
ncbi:MAG TPA: PilZ domain-containing protein [Candidatus Acidoferrales bacterium]|nr:PilZ domain-containing protein [Candidatus Acidoferrales bacterium]